MHHSNDIIPPSATQRALKCLGVALLTLVALAAMQPDFPARLYDLLLVGELTLLSCW